MTIGGNDKKVFEIQYRYADSYKIRKKFGIRFDQTERPGACVLIKPNNENQNVDSENNLHWGNHVQNQWCSISNVMLHIEKPQNLGQGGLPLKIH